MVSRFEISYRYDKYLEVLKETNLLSIGDEEIDYPTKRSIQEDGVDIVMQDVSVNDSHRLLLEYDDRRAGVRFLPPSTLSWLSIKLTELLWGDLSKDQEEYWWFTHDFSRAYNEKVGLFNEGLLDNFELLVRLVMTAPIMHPPKIREIIAESRTLATYLAYPTLEGFVKTACRRDIKMNGEIRKGRKIRRLLADETKCEYLHGDDGDGVCSNLGMLLWHLETEIVRSEHRVLFSKMRTAVGKMYDHPPKHIYGLLNDFRNNSLHGRDRAPKEYGVLLNYICLVIWVILAP